ncbi:DUF362 domain-containing protein [Candidatus Aminicenantes bacterium AH-873-B07]|jgi:uncharacterized protein (DUF362 family)|nr:DUF362 domain-containing protein [Candidatus Aminicenantes bacterium AH-873-B07]
MKRREFLIKSIIGGTALSLNFPLFSQIKTFPDLAMVKGEDPYKITKRAISLLGGMKRFISKGDVVVIKPNIGWDRKPEQGANTNPQVVKAVIELCYEAGAKLVKVLDNPCNQARRTYARSGIAKAAKSAGAKVYFPDPRHLKKINLKGEWLKEWKVFSDFLETDKIVNVPIAKHHSLTKLTMGMKNLIGCLGGNRSQLHQQIDEVITDLSAFFKPCLTILDAYRILIKNGPQGGRLSDVKLQKTVVAGIDYVAIDSCGTTFFGLKPEDLGYLRLAYKRGLGEINWEKLRIGKEKL